MIISGQKWPGEISMKQTQWPNNGKKINENNGIYFHVCNGGPRFEWDNIGGTLDISASSEEWLRTKISFMMHSENLRELATWLIETAATIDANSEIE